MPHWNIEERKGIILMTNRERRERELPYISDAEVFEEQKRTRRLNQALNQVDWSDFEAIKKIAKELLGKSEDVFIYPPFYCDYGTNIQVGKNFFATIIVRFWMWRRW